MFAVILTGGKQYKVRKGDKLKIEKLAGEAGDKVEFPQIAMTGKDADVTVGTPLVEGAKVTGKIVQQARYDKIRVVKFQAKKRHKTIHGHKQAFTEVEITAVK